MATYRENYLQKRGFDLMMVFLSAPLWIPLLVGVAIVVRLRLGSPVFFHQLRPGAEAHEFLMFKFRTMTDARDENGKLLPDAVRLTAFGKWLRATSLDELPELWNVLRGEMSLVGPRPLLMQYLPRYTERQFRRHEMPPGITGWAQVNGRNAISWEQKFDYDVWYVENWSLWLDIKILVLTLRRVITRSNINSPGEATMPEFMGGPEAKNQHGFDSQQGLRRRAK